MSFWKSRLPAIYLTCLVLKSAPGVVGCRNASLKSRKHQYHKSQMLSRSVWTGTALVKYNFIKWRHIFENNINVFFCEAASCWMTQPLWANYFDAFAMLFRNVLYELNWVTAPITSDGICCMSLFTVADTRASFVYSTVAALCPDESQ